MIELNFFYTDPGVMRYNMRYDLSKPDGVHSSVCRELGKLISRLAWGGLPTEESLRESLTECLHSSFPKEDFLLHLKYCEVNKDVLIEKDFGLRKTRFERIG